MATGFVGCARQPATAPFYRAAVGGVIMQMSRNVRVRENQIIENGVENDVPACGAFFVNCAAVEVDDNRIERNGATLDPRQCIEFNAMPVGPIPNPFIDSGVRFDVFQFDGTQLPASEIRQEFGVNGLNLNFRTDIALPGPAASVELTLSFSGKLVKTARALRSDGTVVDTQQTTAQPGPQQLVLTGTGIVRIEVTVPQDETNLTKFCFAPEAPGAGTFQGGIVAIGVFPETFLVPGGPDVAPLTVPRGDPAMTVRGNTVVCLSGQPLFVFGIGAMLVSNNSFTCTGFRRQPLAAFSQPIAIVNFGPSYFLATNPIPPAAFLTQNVMAKPPSPASVLATPGFFDGRILFQNNQVAVKPRIVSPPAFGNACLFYTFDDVAVEGNQFVTEQAVAMFTQVLAFGFTVRMIGNRFNEVPLTAFFSGVTLGQQAMTSLNQATHCLYTFGVQNLQQNNQVAINQLCEVRTSLFDATLKGGQ